MGFVSWKEEEQGKLRYGFSGFGRPPQEFLMR